MRNRFKRRSRTGRNRIRKSIREDVYSRDDYTCQYCMKKPDRTVLSIDHVLPLALGGLDEITNYVTCCKECNRAKGELTPEEFAIRIGLDVTNIPIHGDPIIDNQNLPAHIRIVRKRVVDRLRRREIVARGPLAQKKLEKEYRREFWSTPAGKALEALEPTLPGHVRIMLPEIKIIAKTGREYELMVELAKSAGTRNLIGQVPKGVADVEVWVRSIAKSTRDASLRKRTQWALRRFDKKMRQQAST